MIKRIPNGWLLLICVASVWLAQTPTDSFAQPSTPEKNQDQQREEARRWLERMALAMEHLNYRGTFVYSHSGRLQSLAVVHLHSSSGVRERLYSLDGDAREVRRNNNLVHAVAPEQDHYSQMNYQQFTRLPSSELLKQKSRYSFQLGHKHRIASLPAQQIRIEAKDGFRYGYEFWLEERTGMLLKQVMVDENQQVLEKLVFTNIELGAEIDDKDLNEAITDQMGKPAKQLANVNSQPRWRPAQLPSGFELQVHQQSEDDDDTLEHLLYSDGLAHVSVYLEPQEIATVDTEYPATSYGVVNIYSRSMSGMHITAMGAVPYRTLHLIGGSMYDSSHLKPSHEEQLDSASSKQ